MLLFEETFWLQRLARSCALKLWDPVSGLTDAYLSTSTSWASFLRGRMVPCFLRNHTEGGGGDQQWLSVSWQRENIRLQPIPPRNFDKIGAKNPHGTAVPYLEDHGRRKLLEDQRGQLKNQRGLSVSASLSHSTGPLSLYGPSNHPHIRI